MTTLMLLAAYLSGFGTCVALIFALLLYTAMKESHKHW